MLLGESVEFFAARGIISLAEECVPEYTMGHAHFRRRF
jgi:hypothetical protein